MTNSSSGPTGKDTQTPKPEPKSGPQSNAPTPTGEALADRADGEIGGPKGPEPTRFGDWEQKGRCSDF